MAWIHVDAGTSCPCPRPRTVVCLRHFIFELFLNQMSEQASQFMDELMPCMVNMRPDSMATKKTALGPWQVTLGVSYGFIMARTKKKHVFFLPQGHLRILHAYQIGYWHQMSSVRNRRISKDSDGVEKLDKSAKIAFEDFDLCVTALCLGKNRFMAGRKGLQLGQAFRLRSQARDDAVPWWRRKTPQMFPDVSALFLRMILSYFEDPADPFKMQMPKIYSEAKEKLDELLSLKDTAKETTVKPCHPIPSAVCFWYNLIQWTYVVSEQLVLIVWRRCLQVAHAAVSLQEKYASWQAFWHCKLRIAAMTCMNLLQLLESASVRRWSYSNHL